MFKKNDRVKLDGDHMEHYMDGAICTVVKANPDQGYYGIVSDTDPDPDIPFFTKERFLIHVTNVPSVRPSSEDKSGVTTVGVPLDSYRPRGSDLQPQTPQGVRSFGTGATRDLDANKLDFEGFLSPLVLERYAEHMHKARRMPDGTMRESDNWQLGIPVVVYMKSLFRHFFGVWKLHRGHEVTEVVNGTRITKDLETELCAMLFNTSGMLHEVIKANQAKSPIK